jgi:hypothetical protein
MMPARRPPACGVVGRCRKSHSVTSKRTKWRARLLGIFPERRIKKLCGCQVPSPSPPSTAAACGGVTCGHHLALAPRPLLPAPRYRPGSQACRGCCLALRLTGPYATSHLTHDMSTWPLDERPARVGGLPRGLLYHVPRLDLLQHFALLAIKPRGGG